jgi:glycosyltransferase A (GT-A) superfamily protein (DUF2064 family)
MAAQPPALAIFVKTPSLSPVKTRLAAAIGADAALAVYRASLACVQSAVAEAAAAGHVVPYWAVAEQAGLAHWRDWPALAQAEADLGERMRAIHTELQARHGAAILLGADAPLVTANLIGDVAASLAGPPMRVIVPALDGGFVLFGANIPLAGEPWSAVPYGAPDTAQQFVATVGSGWPLTRHPALPDLDERTDLCLIAERIDERACAPLIALKRLAASLAR